MCRQTCSDEGELMRMSSSCRKHTSIEWLSLFSSTCRSVAVGEGRSRVACHWLPAQALTVLVRVELGDVLGLETPDDRVIRLYTQRQQTFSFQTACIVLRRAYVRQSPFQTWNNSLQPAAAVEGFCLVERSLECRACKTEEGLGRCSDS